MNSALMLHRHAGPAVAGSYALGATSGAAVSAGVLFIANGLISPLPAAWRGALAVCGLVLLGLHRSGVLCLELPERKHQIPRETFQARPRSAAFRFAFELGTGVRTYITAVAPYALAIVVLLCLPAGTAAAAGSASTAALGYGLGRSSVVAIQGVRRAIAVEHPAPWLRAADVVAITAAFAIAVQFLLTS